MRLFLDDFRDPHHCLSYMDARIGPNHLVYALEWEVVRDFHGFVETVSQHHLEITTVSFDHDLSQEHYDNDLMTDNAWLLKFYERQDREMTGYDCALWMRDFYLSKGLELPEILVHSMNPMGTINIEQVFLSDGQPPTAEREGLHPDRK